MQAKNSKLIVQVSSLIEEYNMWHFADDKEQIVWSNIKRPVKQEIV